MPRILVIHGAGMNMRGKVQTEVFGTLTLPEYDVKIREYAGSLGMQVEIFHSNIEGEVINRLYAAHDGGIDATIINPDGFTRGYPALVTAISRVKFPTIEACRRAHREPGRSRGFGIVGYDLALRGLKALLTK